MKLIVTKVTYLQNFLKWLKRNLLVPITNGILNKCISSSTFPDELKIADIILVSKKQVVSDEFYY